ncbi:MAG: twin-arginine translocation signal domain-containing protein [Hyphomicrobiaceae bacterium]|nr:twin-arginine translocation signal domain-containing protein [Hyphomicrobiaceae bacterium]
MSDLSEPLKADLDRRQLIKGAAAGAGAVVLPGIALAQETPRRGGTLRIAIPYNPAAIDPMTGRNLPDFDTLYAVFDALIDFEPRTLELKPGLAKSWTFTDPKTLVLDLAEGVTFHDGTPFNPEAVKINIERYKTDPRSNVKADLVTVDGVEVTGKSQVILKLNRPNAGLPVMLTNRIGLMVSPKLIQEKGPNLDRLAVGTGPFKFVEWQDNTSIKLVRNENYWKSGQPYLDGIEFRIINELNTAVRSAIAGEVDLALNLQPQQKAIADRSPNVIASANPSLVFYGAFLNYAKPPLNDLRVRQAMNYAINRDEINKVIALGLGQTSSVILPKAHWACDAATANYYTFDLDKAKKLLAEAGYPNGLEIESFGWSDQVAMQRQELIISQLAKAQIRIKLTPVAPQQAMQAFMIEVKGSMHISPAGGFPDPSQAYEALFGKDALRNAGKVELPGFRELMDATMSAQDLEARKLAFAKLQKFVVENALQLVQYISPGVVIQSKKVQNFKDNLLTTPKLHDVWLSA